MIRNLLKIIGFIALTAFFLIWVFPYEAMIERSIRFLEARLNIDINYELDSASIMGVRAHNLKVRSPQGLGLEAEQVRIVPSWGKGIVVDFIQKDNRKGTIELDGYHLSSNFYKTEITFQKEPSEEPVKIEAQGTNSLDIKTFEGEGSLKLVLTDIRLPIPIELKEVRLDTDLTYFNSSSPESPSLGVKAQVQGAASDDVGSAEGMITLTNLTTDVVPISGDINFTSPLTSGTLVLGGTLQSPRYSVQPGR